MRGWQFTHLVAVVENQQPAAAFELADGTGVRIGVSYVAAIRYLLEIERLEKRAPAQAPEIGWLEPERSRTALEGRPLS
jgi:hypothetical protein